MGQISFDGNPILVDSLSSPNGQNYLIVDHSSNRIAFTEEVSGAGSGQLEISTKSIALEGATWEVVVLPDFLGKKGMISPLGFTSSGLLVNKVDFGKGVYTGQIQLISQDELLSGIEIPFFKNRGPIQSGCISADGNFLIISMESNNSYGVEDLYVSKRNADGAWGSLKNLGYQINTDFQEITPFLAADNRTLIFATNGRGGKGSFDLFSTTRLDNSWRNWSVPKSLGDQINTSGSETSFSFQDGGKWAWFVSSQDSDGYGEILRIKIKEEIDADTTSVQEVLMAEVTLQAVEVIKLKIVDAFTNASIGATLINGIDTINNVNGLFTVDSLNSEEIEIKAPGYLPKMVMLDEQLRVGENVIALSSIAVGNTIALENVLFRRGTADMVEGSGKELDLVVEVMNDNPNIKILLKGHTDNTGDPVLNVKLSEERVKSVKEYLISRGISPYRVTGRGYGGNEPLASNATEESRKLNRRVEFEVLED